MSRHLVDPELAAMLDVFPGITLSHETIVAMRAQMGEMALPRETYARPNVTIEDKVVPGPDGAPDVPVTLYRPTDATGKLPVLLYLHGGGYVMGTAESGGAGNVRTADEVKCLVVSVDYRLAPETRAPGAAGDAHALLPGLGLPPDLMAVDIARLSTGERQRLALVRSLAVGPDVLLLDEPTASLDAASTAAVEALLRERMDSGLAVLLVTHSREQAARMGQRAFDMIDGALHPA